MTPLSPREREVVELIGRDGAQWETVARLMGLHIGTVRSYAQRIMRKCNVNRAPRDAMVEVYWRYVAVTSADTVTTAAE